MPPADVLPATPGILDSGAAIQDPEVTKAGGPLPEATGEEVIPQVFVEPRLSQINQTTAIILGTPTEVQLKVLKCTVTVLVCPLLYNVLFSSAKCVSLN